MSAAQPTQPGIARSLLPDTAIDWKPLVLVPALALLAIPFVGSTPTWITLTAAGRKLKSRAAKIPGCILSATQCSIPELMSLTQQVQALRRQLVA